MYGQFEDPAEIQHDADLEWERVHRPAKESAESIFGPHVQQNGTFVREFFNGRTLRHEAWLEEVTEGREGANWKTWFVNDITNGGHVTRHHSLESATDDYNQRVAKLIAN